ncbi:MAG: FkbM family methyltransferase [Nostoc sp. RI_552]|nr:FkbM family methyltransferase [Nostoc sp. RI_552]
MENYRYFPPPQIIQITEDIEFKIIPHFQEFDSESLFFRKLSYESEVFKWLKQHTSEYNIIIEIGANIGIFSLFFWKAFLHYNKNANNIFVFEPSRKAYLRLLKNLEINQANSIQTYNCAVSDITGFIDFFEPQGHLTNGSLNKEFAGLFSNQVLCSKAMVVNANYLNNLVNSSQDHVLMKIDVEGSEFEVLSGMKNFILACKPTIIIEVLSMYELKLNSLEFLHETYNLYNLTKEGLVQYFEFNSTAYRDYVLLPK